MPSHDNDNFSESSHDEETSTQQQDGDAKVVAEEEEEDPEFVLVKKVTRAVRAIRAVVFLVLFLAAALTAILVYRYTKHSEQQGFEKEFDIVAEKIMESLVGGSISIKFWMARTLAASIQLALKLTDSNALNLTMPEMEWDSLTGEMRVQANTHVVAWSPLLSTTSDRVEFEKHFQQFEVGVGDMAGRNPPCFLCGEPTSGYSNPEDIVTVTGFGTDKCSRVENLGRTGIIPESLCDFAKVQVGMVCQCAENMHPEEDESTQKPVVDFVFTLASNGSAVYDTSDPPFLPIRHVELLSGYKKPTLYNQMSDPVRARALRNMIDNKLPVLSETFLSDGTYASNYTGFEGETGAIVFFPVFDEQENVIGAISGEFAWRNFMTAVFPAMAEHVLVVIENSCGPNISYSIDPIPNRLVKIGDGDVHEDEFSDMVLSSTYEEFEATVNYAASRKPDYTKVMEYCRYKYHIYPRSSFKDEHITSDPWLFSSVAAAIFLFTGMTFFVYDLIVAFRQRAVMATARQTHNIVSSLYPKEVRQRLMNANKRKGRPRQQLANFLTGTASDSESGSSSDPIAELFPHATVAFIDIVNFTAWSSERDPTQVFRLLEAIYGGFDDIAKSLGVFKVETIGDSVSDTEQ
eukprot:scaffold3732_cov147-Amphora_coffeaeformis.AAC.2